jgi:MFS family permease
MRVYCIFKLPTMTAPAALQGNHHVCPPPRRSSGLILLTLAFGFVMAMLDVTAVNVALSDIALDLAMPLTGLVWVVDGYTLTFAALLWPAARWPTATGRKPCTRAAWASSCSARSCAAPRPTGIA